MSRDPQIVARLLVTLLQIERNDEIGGQPQRQRRQRLSDRQDVRPAFKDRSFLPLDPATRGGVGAGRWVAQRRVVVTDERQHLGVEVEMTLSATKTVPTLPASLSGRCLTPSRRRPRRAGRMTMNGTII